MFKENTKKEVVIKTEPISKKKSGVEKLKDHIDEKYNQVRIQREMKRNYLSTISTRYNPDLIIGEIMGAETKTGFIRGNEYFMDKPSEKKAKVTDEREKSAEESAEEGQYSEQEQEPEAEDSEESAFENLKKNKG